MFLICLLVELVVLIALAWMDKLPHFIANVATGLIAFCFLAFFRDDNSFGVNLGVCALLAFFACLGGSILWSGVRFVCLGIENPRAALEAIDTAMMERAVAKSLAGKPSNPLSYGNQRVAQEVVRALKEGDSKE
jgi:hypothetical protein